MDTVKTKQKWGQEEQKMRGTSIQNKVKEPSPQIKLTVDWYFKPLKAAATVLTNGWFVNILVMARAATCETPSQSALLTRTKR